MKSFAITSVLLFLAGGAMARNCTPGLNYCGSTLNNIGNYQGQIDQALHDAGRANGGSDDLFHCVGGDSGVIDWIGYCPNGCRDNGKDVSDSCN
ncbi:hypothetical protein QBC33DRAFT_566834 [Phialemonium atrogriseum]|uniref:Uncharacterized protein n=1 Tax=Phialemonium atrogriseum TaxID=1093897 RepID=A0AAJ0C5L2_9PEZI|nr:uncharacterized protein QBC33DRAFT_566834 [Phialemonium atrogriseum]KAK1770395.1 hypothetical protein QBC33DRAFT_566834 [Phialemonium atrogriseum]